MQPIAPSHAAASPAALQGPLRVAVVGSGIAGLSAAWLLARRHRVRLFEADARAGGHSHTVDAATPRGPLAVDTGFIVYNEPAYPNLAALFGHLGVATRPAEMSFGVSLDTGALEYAGSGLNGLFAQRANLLRPRFWAMLRELLRFYRQAPRDAAAAGLEPLDAYLDRRGYGRALREDHLYPMAAASCPTAPCSAWSAARTACACARAPAERFDQVVLACHADQALRLLPDAGADEQRLLGAFGYSRNLAVLHSDPALMPRRRAVWSAWNYLADRRRPGAPCVTYWMNRLQGLDPQAPLFVTLNPIAPPRPEHPLLTLKVIAGIHWEALRLWRRGVPLQPRPAAPAQGATLVPHPSSPSQNQAP